MPNHENAEDLQRLEELLSEAAVFYTVKDSPVVHIVFEHMFDADDAEELLVKIGAPEAIQADMLNIPIKDERGVDTEGEFCYSRIHYDLSKGEASVLPMLQKLEKERKIKHRHSDASEADAEKKVKSLLQKGGPDFSEAEPRVMEVSELVTMMGLPKICLN